MIVTMLAVMSLLSISCENFLDKEPLDKIGNKQYWTSSKDLENYTIQFYTKFKTFNANDENYIGIFGGDAFSGSDNAIHGYTPNDYLNGTRSVVANNAAWNWESIRQVNIFFGNYAKCQDDISMYQHFGGEAHFFRAFFYFAKVQQFGDVPYYQNELSMQDESLYKARDPRSLVVDSILSDLDKSITFLDPLHKVSGGRNRLSKEAALLFKSRVTLYEGTWQKYHAGTEFASAGVDPSKYFRIAVDAVDELLRSPSVGISTGQVTDAYYELFNKLDYSNNKEILLWRRYSAALSQLNAAQMFLSNRPSQVGMTMSLVASYLDKDGEVYDMEEAMGQYKGNAFLVQMAANLDPRFAQSIRIPGDLMWNNANGINYFDKPAIDMTGELGNSTGFHSKKGSDPKGNTAGGVYSVIDENGAIVFRFAEALLNYAEAKAELGEVIDYDNTINKLRQRVGMPDFKIINEPNKEDYGYPISDQLYEIRRERRSELAMEDFRVNDIKRWRAHKLIQGKRPKGYPFDPSEWNGLKPKVDSKGLLDPMSASMPNGYGFKENRDYLNCIPTAEIVRNPNLKPNPGW